ncbi:glycoside hydrolase family 25 protein [Flavobacterium sp. Sd200]|uniref:glycoside hydrolase family 25 protein n=1 Tax=Flavobacterium sp. Sd200 TaxID=2692211 RepID=UPI00136FEBF1|nr:glycoside hydrolase family 25 protein [Flavobacterium sp. Sd200]MXN91992.1 glycoside hydrolase family 25 protein [Flavobacterium sp. Sd200]
MKRTPQTKKTLPVKATSKAIPKKNVPQKRGSKTKAKQSKITSGTILKYSVLLLVASFIIAAAYQYRNGFLYYLGFKTNKRISVITKEERKIADLRLYEIVTRHKNKVFGFDVSHYQGIINWDSIERTKGDFPLDFVFIRATAGTNANDTQFKTNWRKAKQAGFIRGAYHYYRPDENSVKQAANFIKTVTLKRGDLPPVLDIEKVSRRQNMDSLKSGLRKWLAKVEKHYGVKPIIYSGESYYTDFLKEEFADYNLWIANYSFFEEEIRKEWLFWQFTDKGSIKGIEGNVDVNIYNGQLTELDNLRIK